MLQSHRQRPFLILRGIGRVDRPGDVVEPEFTREPGGKVVEGDG
jgi:hypothetical protein